MPKFTKAALVAAMLLVSFLPQNAFACACGCGLFQVGTSSLLPQGAGGTMSLEYDYMNQTDNYNGGHNHDHHIASTYVTAGAQYMFDRSWGIDVRAPFLVRDISTKPHGYPVSQSVDLHTLGDVRVSGLYTGFSADMSTGIEFGLKLPTGRYDHNIIERSEQAGTGSTDLLLGGFTRGRFAKNQPYGWFVHAALSQPLMTQNHYRPGAEFNVAAGAGHDPVELGHGVKVAPLLQFVGTSRLHDGGGDSEPENSGYARLAVSPGLEFSFKGGTRLYTDVSLPVAEHVRGQQLVAPVYVKAVLSHDF